MNPDKPTVLQFHWQHEYYLCRTVLVEQSPPLRSLDEALAWCRSLDRYSDQWPAEHVAMVCDRGSEHFIRPVARPTRRPTRRPHNAAGGS